MSPLRFKVYSRTMLAGKRTESLIAATKHVEEAAAIVSMNSFGRDDELPVIKADGVVVWREGIDGCAGDGYDTVACKVWERIEAVRQRRYAKHRALVARQEARFEYRRGEVKQG